ncbi:MAG: ABC transporter ATP-binding protein, partial [Agathobacter sp.]|nr:ABC transporter ATP-binding protein [Agathobacter sp.]
MAGPGPRGPRGPVPKIKNPGKLLARLMKFLLSRYAVHYLVVLICIFLSVFCSVQGTLFLTTLIDDYIKPMVGVQNPDFGPLLGAMSRVAVFYLIGVVAAFVQQKVLIYVSQGCIRDMRNELFSHMQDLPIRYFDTHAHGDIMSVYTNDIDTLRQMVSQSIPQMINSVVTVITVFINMCILSIPLTLLSVLVVVITVIVSKHFAGFSSRYFLAQQKDLGKVNGFVEEMLSGQKVVKVFTHEDENMEEFNKLNDTLFDSANNANFYANCMGPVNNNIGNVGYVLCTMVGGILAFSGFGGFTLGKLASFLNFNKSFSQPINQITQQMNSIIMALAGCERIFALLDEEPETD